MIKLFSSPAGRRPASRCRGPRLRRHPRRLGERAHRLMLAQSRLDALQRGQRDARAIGQTSMNLLFSDLRMVHDGGDAPGSVMIASPERSRVHVPYAVGLVCGNGVTVTDVSMLPVDSAANAMAKYAGFAWRDRVSRKYTYVPVVDTLLNAPVTTSASPTTCTTTAKIKTRHGQWPQLGPVDLKPISATAGVAAGRAGVPVSERHVLLRGVDRLLRSHRAVAQGRRPQRRRAGRAVRCRRALQVLRSQHRYVDRHSAGSARQSRRSVPRADGLQSVGHGRAHGRKIEDGNGRAVP